MRRWSGTITAVFLLLGCMACGPDHLAEESQVYFELQRQDRDYGLLAATLSTNGITNPTSANDLDCFAVLVQRPTAPPVATCHDGNSVPILSVHQASAAVFVPTTATSGEIRLSVPNGSDVNFHLVGFKTITGSCPPDLSLTEVEKRYISNLFILGSATADLNGGSVTVPLSGSMTGAEKLVSCTGAEIDFAANTCDTVATPTNFTDIGSGTAGDPYVLCNATQMETIGISATSNVFKLGANINYSGVTTPHTMIGTAGNPFTGTFDGNYHKVDGFTHNAGTTGAVRAFIGAMSGGTVKNIELQNVAITGQSELGGLVGSCSSCTMQNVKVSSGTITGSNTAGATDNIGSIVGTMTSGTLDRAGCGASLVASTGKTGAAAIGGCVGRCASCTIGKAASTASISAGNATADSIFDLGGVLGAFNGSGTIFESFFSGTITITLDNVPNTCGVGGIVSNATTAGGTISISDVYANVTINSVANTSHLMAGGISASLEQSGGATAQMTRSYARGTITNNGSGVNSRTGGLVGKVTSTTISQSFATVDITFSGGNARRDFGVSSGETTTGTKIFSGSTCVSCGVTSVTAEATLSNFYLPSFAPLSTWDFVNDWSARSGNFPLLRNAGNNF